MVAVPEVDPASPPWFQRWALRFAQLINAPATAPTQLYARETADLPPAADWRGRIMYDLTLDQVVYSDGSAWNAL